MKRIIIIRYTSLALILAGFFLPWLDTGEASLARVTLSGLELAIGQDGYPSIEAFPELFAVLFFGLLITVNNKPKHTLLVLFLPIYFIVFCSPSGLGSVPAPYNADLGSLNAGLERGSSKYNYWAFGKVLTVIGFVTLMATGFLKQHRVPVLGLKSTKFIVIASWVIIAHLILLHLVLREEGIRRAVFLLMIAAVVGVLKCIFIRFLRGTLSQD